MDTERKLIGRAMAGEKKAFGELVERYERPLFAFINKKINDRDRTLDLVQETFIDAFVSLSSLQDLDRFAPWLFTIARRKAWLAVNRENHLFDMFDPVPLTCDDADPVLRRELSELVRTAINALPEKMRQSVEMHYLQELPYADASAELDIPVSIHKNRLHLAREKLRDHLAPFFDEFARKPNFIRRKSKMKFPEPTIEITELPGVKMAVDLIEDPIEWVKLKKNEKTEKICYRPGWGKYNHEEQLHYKYKVVGRAVVEGEECWEINDQMYTPDGKCRRQSSVFKDRREDGFYSFASVHKPKQGKTEIYCKPGNVRVNFPCHIQLGMAMATSDWGHRLKVQRVVNVQINSHSFRALEVICVCTPLGENGTQVLRFDRKFVSENGRMILTERYHYFDPNPSEFIKEQLFDTIPLVPNCPQMEFEGRKYFRYWTIVPKEFLTK